MKTLITTAEVINGGLFRPAPTSARFDAHLIAPHIKDAEARFVVPVLCREFYDKLIEVKGDNVSNYNSAVGAIVQAFPDDEAYERLWTEHLLSFCAYSVLYEAYPFIAVQLGSNGLYLNSTEFGENVGIAGVKFMQDTLLQRIEHKRDKLAVYLCEHKEVLVGFCHRNCRYCYDEGGVDKELGVVFY